MFKKIIISFLLSLLIIATITPLAGASVRVRGYYKSSGTYVGSHYRSNYDSSFYNNWSTKGNTNPYTGSSGYKRKY